MQYEVGDGAPIESRVQAVSSMKRIPATSDIAEESR
jgi:hypothetical protein